MVPGWFLWFIGTRFKVMFRWMVLQTFVPSSRDFPAEDFTKNKLTFVSWFDDKTSECLLIDGGFKLHMLSGEHSLTTNVHSISHGCIF